MNYAAESGGFTLATGRLGYETGLTSATAHRERRLALEFTSRVQVRQWNDWEILDFFNSNDVSYSLTGDHLFVMHGRTHDLRAGPGDWLSIGCDGDVEVEQGVEGDGARRAIEDLRGARM